MTSQEGEKLEDLTFDLNVSSQKVISQDISVEQVPLLKIDPPQAPLSRNFPKQNWQTYPKQAG